MVSQPKRAAMTRSQIASDVYRETVARKQKQTLHNGGRVLSTWENPGRLHRGGHIALGLREISRRRWEKGILIDPSCHMDCFREGDGHRSWSQWTWALRTPSSSPHWPRFLAMSPPTWCCPILSSADLSEPVLPPYKPNESP